MVDAAARLDHFAEAGKEHVKEFVIDRDVDLPFDKGRAQRVFQQLFIVDPHQPQSGEGIHVLRY